MNEYLYERICEALKIQGEVEIVNSITQYQKQAVEKFKRDPK